MPKAVADLVAVEHFDLKSCEGGFVRLRRLSYGQKLQRQNMASKMAFEGGGGRKKDSRAIMESAVEAVTLFEFSCCIAEHNLEDEHGNLLNFSAPRDVQRLDPRIGEEIDGLISKLNNFEAQDEENTEGN